MDGVPILLSRNDGDTTLQFVVYPAYQRDAFVILGLVAAQLDVVNEVEGVRFDDLVEIIAALVCLNVPVIQRHPFPLAQPAAQLIGHHLGRPVDSTVPVHILPRYVEQEGGLARILGA